MRAQRSKSLAWIVAMGFAAVGFASVETAYARQVKVNVCHMTGNGAYHLITIAEPALQAHINRAVPDLPCPLLSIPPPGRAADAPMSCARCA